MVAASWSPLAGRRLTYPWGDTWKASAANVGTLEGETPLAEPGSYLDDLSPMGFFDMAGNVSEWTSTPSSSDMGRYFVKGGSNHHATERRVKLDNNSMHAPPELRLEIIGLRVLQSAGENKDSERK